MIDVDLYAVDIHQQNKKMGWWENPDRCIYEALQLVSTEIAEATEGERKNLMDDHLPHRKMGEVELADALIRLLDLAGRYGWAYYKGTKCGNLFDSMDTIGAQHLVLNCMLCDVSVAIKHGWLVNTTYSTLVAGIFYVANSQGYDIEGAMVEKFSYNLFREDHKPENRAAKNGKKF